MMFLIGSLLLATLVSATDTITPFVVQLHSKKELDEFIAAEPASIIKFYAPWCGHCKRMAPAFEQAGEQLKGEARLADVDCTQHKEVCAEFSVRGYPTLLVFKAGEHEKYVGARDVDAFVGVVRAALPEQNEGEAEAEEDVPVAVTVIESTEALDAFIAAEPATIVKFYAPWCGHCKRMAPAFEQAGEQLHGEARLAEVDCTQNRELCAKFGVRGFPTLKVFSGSDNAEQYAGARDADAFVKTVRDAIAAVAEASGEGEQRRDEL